MPKHKAKGQNIVNQKSSPQRPKNNHKIPQHTNNPKIINKQSAKESQRPQNNHKIPQHTNNPKIINKQSAKYHNKANRKTRLSQQLNKETRKRSTKG